MRRAGAEGLPVSRRPAPAHATPLVQLFDSLTPTIRAELLEERDPHGNVQVGAS